MQKIWLADQRQKKNYKEESLLVIHRVSFREKDSFVSVYVDDIKLAGNKHNIDLMWKVLNKEVDFGEPTSVLDSV